MYFATLQIKSLLVIWEKSIFWAVVEWFVLGMIVWSTLPVWDAQSESCPAEDFWEKKKQKQLSEPKAQLRILWMPILSESLSYITFLFNKQFTALEICLSTRTNLFSFFLGVFLTEAYIFPFCDKQPVSSTVKSWGSSKTPGVILLFSEKSGQPHHGVPEGCGGTQGHARCGFNLD